ncbi:MAG: hypothetical protein UF208_07855, partial [Coprococcus comes]|nr:hypothetical protein [Coprococcus comes]
EESHKALHYQDQHTISGDLLTKNGRPLASENGRSKTEWRPLGIVNCTLAEMMILRDLLDNRREQLSELSRKVQKSLDETKKSCNELISSGLIESVGKEYMLTAKVYEALKSDVEYTRDKTVQYIKAKNMILEYLQTNDQITSAKIQEMCGFTKQQARSVIDKMRSEKLINLNGKGPAARYVIFDGLSDN